MIQIKIISKMNYALIMCQAPCKFFDIISLNFQNKKAFFTNLIFQMKTLRFQKRVTFMTRKRQTQMSTQAHWTPNAHCVTAFPSPIPECLFDEICCKQTIRYREQNLKFFFCLTSANSLTLLCLLKNE